MRAIGIVFRGAGKNFSPLPTALIHCEEVRKLSEDFDSLGKASDAGGGLVLHMNIEFSTNSGPIQILHISYGKVEVRLEGQSLHRAALSIWNAESYLS